MANEYLDKAGLSAVWEKIVDKINNSLVDNDYMTVVSANEISTESNINDNNIPTTSAVKKLIDTELENVPTDSFKNDAIKGGSSGTSASIYGGKKSFATGDCSLAVGNGVSATGAGSVALGEGATLNGKLCAAGRDSIVAGHAFRSGIISATGETSIAIGKAGTDKASVVAGNTGSIAIGTIEIVEGPDTIAANGQAALAMGYIIDSDDGGDVFTTSSGSIVANGRGSMARGMVFGGDIISEGDGSHAEGYVKAEGYIQAIGNGAVAIGVANEKSLIASGEASVAIGLNTSATGKAAHAEGEETLAAAGGAHAEGVGTTAYYGSHAEGFATLASGVGAHAGGQSIFSEPQQAGYTSAIGNGAFAHGQGAKALANNSVAFGDHTTSNAANCTVFGKYNATTDAPFVVGWGNNSSDRKDLFIVQEDGTISADTAKFNNLDAKAKGLNYDTLVSHITYANAGENKYRLLGYIDFGNVNAGRNGYKSMTLLISNIFYNADHCSSYIINVAFAGNSSGGFTVKTAKTSLLDSNIVTSKYYYNTETLSNNHTKLNIYELAGNVGNGFGNSRITVLQDGDTYGFIGVSENNTMSVLPSDATEIEYSNNNVMNTTYNISNIGHDELFDKVAHDDGQVQYINAYKFSNGNVVGPTDDGIVINIPWSTKYGRQICVDDESYSIWSRYRNNDVWSEWAQINSPNIVVGTVGSDKNTLYLY